MDGTPTRRRTQLDTLADVQRCLAQTIRSLRRLKLSDLEKANVQISQAKAMVYALKTLSEMMAHTALEQRLDALERKSHAPQPPPVQ